ncbi:protein NUCLEAR FUSION DEFECTIVE 4-like [Phalaenopsis equestris]|nr:protein NUCLEAR FUSION DEFECTIVE 4-like [Phalaenopsis equestris]
MAKDRLVLLGEEHGAKSLIHRLDFWIYYMSYFCGGTLGLVYSNNLGQIAQSLGRTSMLVNLYSSCSFFGRLLSAAPDFLGRRFNFARTGWLAAALVPMPLAFFLLAAYAEPGDGHALLVGTALVGLSSGFIFAGAVSATSELFGPESFGVNHNIVITNIPLGSQLYGLLAALVYDANGRVVGSWHMTQAVAAMLVCMGRRCYSKTFLAWGAISTFGLAFAILLYLRTRAAYNRAARCVGRRPVPCNREDLR